MGSIDDQFKEKYSLRCKKAATLLSQGYASYNIGQRLGVGTITVRAMAKEWRDKFAPKEEKEGTQV